MNPGIPQCKNCWKWGHATFSCRVQDSKCIKCNGPHKSEHHQEFGWCCKMNAKTNPPRLETKKRNHAPTCSSTQIAKETTKRTPTNVHFGDTGSIGNSIRRSMLRSMKTDSNQFILKGTAQLNNDCEKTSKIFSQNIRKNSLIINTLLDTLNQFDIILIQEPPWSEIRKIPSTMNSNGKPLIGTSHHPNWISFTRIPLDEKDFPRVITYVNIHLSSLCFLLCKDIINYRDISLISFQ